MVVAPPQIVVYGCPYKSSEPALRNDIPLFLLLKHRVQPHLCIPKQFLKTRVSHALLSSR